MSRINRYRSQFRLYQSNDFLENSSSNDTKNVIDDFTGIENLIVKEILNDSMERKFSGEND
jgi:hypothetical protein